MPDRKKTVFTINALILAGVLFICYWYYQYIHPADYDESPLMKVARHPATVFAAGVFFGRLGEKAITIVVGVLLLVSLYIWVNLNPAFFLIISNGEESESTSVSLTEDHDVEPKKTGTGISYRITNAELPREDAAVIVTNDARLYRVEVIVRDHATTFWPFLGHDRVDLTTFVVDRDLSVRVSNQKRGEEEASREFSIGEGAKTLADQCDRSTVRYELNLADGAECVTLLRAVFEDMSINPDSVKQKRVDAVSHGDRCYAFEYTFSIRNDKPINLTLFTVAATNKSRRRHCPKQEQELSNGSAGENQSLGAARGSARIGD